MGLPILAKPSPASETVVRAPAPWSRVAAVLTGVALVVLPVAADPVWRATEAAMRDYQQPVPPGLPPMAQERDEPVP